MAVNVNQIAEILCLATHDEIDAINVALAAACNKYVINTIPPNTIIDLP